MFLIAGPKSWTSTNVNCGGGLARPQNIAEGLAYYMHLSAKRDDGDLESVSLEFFIDWLPLLTMLLLRETNVHCAILPQFFLPLLIILIMGLLVRRRTVHFPTTLLRLPNDKISRLFRKNLR
mmetsp:Transcript_23521/g.51024  ORF Transcript_23521/g.51024 Transcript_23521/m.51024 type:complete len:122 (+) Transcript_23521:1388-1753(+)